MTLPDEHFRSIAEAAVLAPSADNRHRWRLVRDGPGLVLETTEPLPPPGYRRALALLSLGAAVENVVIAATRLGLAARPTVASGESVYEPLRIDIALSAQHTPADPLAEAIPKRHTNRRLAFRGPPLTADRLQQLAACATGHTHLLWMDTKEARAAAVRLVTAAEGRRFRDPALHTELFSAIRFDAGWRRTVETGLPPGALEVEPLLRPAFKALRHWRTMSLFNIAGGDRLMGWRAAGLPVRLAPHLGVIVSASPDDTGLIDAGRSLERTWLLATVFGLAFQPLPAAAIYALPGSDDPHGVSRDLRDMLAAGWHGVVHDGVAAVIFRLGHAAPPSITAGRPPAESVTATAKEPDA